MDGRSPRRRLLRLAAGWLPAVLLVPAAVVGVVTVSDLDDDFLALRAVQPLDPGTTWVYAVEDHGESSGTRTSQVVGRTSLLGYGDGFVDASMVTRDYTSYPGVGRRSTTSYLGVDGHTLEQYAVIEGSEFKALDPPAPAYRVPAVEDARYGYDGTLGDEPFAFTTRVEAIEDVEVSGRTFTGCAHWVNEVQVAQEDGPALVDVVEEWTCPGFGPVKAVETLEEYDLQVTEELIEYHGPAGNWISDDAQPPEVDTGSAAPGSTQAIDVARSNAVPEGRLGEELAWTDARPGQPILAPVSDGEVMVHAKPDGELSGRATRTGEVLWRVQVAAPVMATPLVTLRAVLVADSTRRLWAFSLRTGRALWVHHFDDVVSTSPALTPDGVAVPTDDGRLSMLDLTDGELQWDTDLEGVPRNPPAVRDSTIFLVDPAGTLTALDTADGSERWSRTQEGGILQGPTLAAGADGLVLTVGADGVLHGYAPEDGDEAWAEGVRDAVLPMAVADGVVVVPRSETTMSGYDVATGERRWTARVPRSSAAPVVVGDEVVVATRDGQVVLLSLADGHRTRSWRLPPPEDGTTFYVDVSPGLVGDDLVFTATTSGDFSGTVVYAYPVRGEGDGVLLHLTEHDLPGVPNEAPVLVGDDLVVSTADRLVRSGPDGAVDLATADTLMAGAVVRDGTAYVRVGSQLQAVDVTSGEVAWSFEAGFPELGAQPGVGADTVFVGLAGTELVALDRDTGRVRWRVTVDDGYSTQVPLVLDDGDVVYGGGPLTRYDARTGAPVWQAPDTYLFGTATRSGGLVYAQVIGAEQPPGLAAFDPATGERVWFADQPAIPDYIGPAAGEGIVVATDTEGTVAGWDAESGSQRWSVDLGRPLAGTPTVADGVVLLVEAGTGRGLTDRDYRVTALDLHTGDFLGAWEPGIMPFHVLDAPLVGASEDGHPLVPVTGSLAEVEALR